MSSTTSPLRRISWIILFSAIGGAILAWRRSQADVLAPLTLPEWPEFSPATTSPNGSSPPATQESAEPAASWLKPLADGSCPPSHPIKAKKGSGIYHVAGGRFYERTKPDRCYATESAAVSGGYRKSKT